MHKFDSHDATFAYVTAGKEGEPKLPLIIWAHGWGQNHHGFRYFLPALENKARHIALDFPGFGEASEPPDVWGTKDYADALAAWMKKEGFPPVIWIGHSFGCRVGTQLAAHYPECVQGMVYIGGAGLKRPRPFYKKAYLYFRVRLFKALKRFVPEGNFKQKLLLRFGNADYNQTSGIMRKIFVRVVNEDLIEESKKISCPVALIYGTEDTETPVSIGKKYEKLLQNATLFVLEGQDHYSLLQDGRHRVIKIISEFLEKGSSCP